MEHPGRQIYIGTNLRSNESNRAMSNSTRKQQTTFDFNSFCIDCGLRGAFENYPIEFLARLVGLCEESGVRTIQVSTDRTPTKNSCSQQDGVIQEHIPTNN